jgi:release factor glutamine methyltransferase
LVLIEQSGKIKTLLQVLRLAESYLKERGIPSARLSAEHLLASVLGVGRLELYLSFDRPLVERELARYRELLRRRAEREPLQYILGGTSFRELNVDLGTGVMVPRPETELLVDLVLDRLDTIAEKTGAKNNYPLKVIDLCTGSGVIGLSLARERAGLWCLLTDISREALAWAEKNYRQPGSSWQSKVSFLCGDLLEPLAQRPLFEVAVANPPYVSTEELELLPEEIKRYEPIQALAGGGIGGTGVIGRIIRSSPQIMKRGGLLALEIGEMQEEKIRALFDEQESEYGGIEFHRDLAGKMRFVTAFRN